MAYKKLDPEFKEKWLAALRSGRYNQTRSTLRKGSGKGASYCCLGVACNLIDSKSWYEEHGYRGVGYCGWQNFDSGATRTLGFVSAAVGQRLSTLNDADEYDFLQIADWIEKYL